MAQVNTSHFDIANYWKDKYISSDGSETSKGEPVVVDFGEPVCWACGKPVVGDYEKSSQEDKSVDYKRLWNDRRVKNGLNRCHIIPGSFGGTDSPDNLFLLCPSCHTLSPDTRNRRSFLRWVFEQRYYYSFDSCSPNSFFQKVSTELKTRGIGDIHTVISLLDRDIDYGDLDDFLKNNAGTHCTACVESTRVCAVADYLQKKLLENCLKEVD